MKINNDILTFTTNIISAYVAHNSLNSHDIVKLIKDVYNELSKLNHKTEETHIKNTSQKPFVPINESVKPDYLICLEDGKKLKMLKRHIRNAYNLTPEAYRLKWGLDPNYPMVCKNYAKTRSEVAKKIGLGQKG